MGQKINVTQRTLRDVRDTNSYTVRKLADGNCWMTSNLRYELKANVVATGSYNNGTTFSFTPTSCAQGGACAFNGSSMMEEPYPSGGFYYNWFAATAGKGGYRVQGDVNGSICPTQWKLPYYYTVSASKSYAGLTNTYGLTTNGQNRTGTFTDNSPMTDSPLAFPLAGFRTENGDAEGVQYAGTLGMYLSSSAMNSEGIPNYMGFGAGNLLVTFYDYRSLAQAMSVRCVHI